MTAQFSAYAVVADRTVGDQPGRHTRRYITEWKSLPEGMLFAPYKLLNRAPGSGNEYTRSFPLLSLPFPSSQSDLFPLPYIGFNARGQLLSQRDEIIAVARGSVFVARNPNGTVSKATPDVQLLPPANGNLPPGIQTNIYTFARINWLTGRTKLELPDFPPAR
jgi:hypothetical protein